MSIRVLLADQLFDDTGLSLQIMVDGGAINIIGLEDLKKNKSASARTNDLDDLANLP